MPCYGISSILVFIYLINQGFSVVSLNRDQKFIDHLLPRLEYSYFKHLFNKENWISNEELDKYLIKYNAFKVLSILNQMPELKRCNKLLEYGIKTQDFLTDIRLEDLDIGRKRKVKRSTVIYKPGEFSLCKQKTEHKFYEEEHRNEVGEFISVIMNMIRKTDKAISCSDLRP